MATDSQNFQLHVPQHKHLSGSTHLHSPLLAQKAAEYIAALRNSENKHLDFCMIGSAPIHLMVIETSIRATVKRCPGDTAAMDRPGTGRTYTRWAGASSPAGIRGSSTPNCSPSIRRQRLAKCSITMGNSSGVISVRPGRLLKLGPSITDAATDRRKARSSEMGFVANAGPLRADIAGACQGMQRLATTCVIRPTSCR